jgi:NitT/TauT family transport system substrate-binding protein
MAMVDLTRLTRSAALAPFAALSRLTSFAAPAGLTLFAALAWPLAADAGTAIHFTLDRKIDGPAAPFFLAIDKGYFKAEGLDVTIDAATGGPLEAIDRLATGASDMGVADINFLIKFRDSNPGTPIKALFVVFDKPPYAIIARKSRGIVAPKDLAGKKLGAPSTDPAFAAWPIFANVNGIDAAKVAIENVGLPVREPMLAAGELDAITGSSFTAYVDLKDRGVPPDDLVVLLMADYGVELYGDAIMASPKFAQEKPEAVRAFLRAYVKALKDTVRDPARAVEAVLHRSDAAKKDIELERLRMAIRDNIVTPAVKANGYGSIDPERFAAALDQLALTYHFKAKDKAAAVFDPSFLPPAAERRVNETASR